MSNASNVADTPVFTSTLDALVTVLVKAAEVLPHLLLPLVDNVTLSEVLKARLQPPNSLDMKLVLV